MKNNLKSLITSFSFAIRGLIFCINNERNMRIHVCVSFFVTFFSFFYDVSKTEYIIILISICIVMSCEMINTSIEQLVNLSTSNYNNIAKIVKDVAAGAVFISSIISFIIALLIFNDISRVFYTILYIITNPFLLIISLAAIVLSYFFIFNGTKLFLKK